MNLLKERRKGKTLREIGEKLGISPQAVHKRLGERISHEKVRLYKLNRKTEVNILDRDAVISIKERSRSLRDFSKRLGLTYGYQGRTILDFHDLKEPETPILTLTCQYCGEEFERPEAKTRDYGDFGPFCSRECMGQYLGRHYGRSHSKSRADSN